MRETIRALRQNYDTTLIDTAPLMLASDTCALRTMVDRVMLLAGDYAPERNIRSVPATGIRPSKGVRRGV
jgi:hypothetical protein